MTAQDEWGKTRRNRQRALERAFGFTTLDSPAAVRNILDEAVGDLLYLTGPLGHENRIMRAFALAYLSDVALRALKAGDTE